MIVNNKSEFDAIMASATATTLIELPGGNIDWELAIDKPCTVLGNNTIIDLRLLDIDYAILLTAAADVSNITLYNKDTKDGVYINNCNPSLTQITSEARYGFIIEGNGIQTEFMGLLARNSEKGFYIHNARNFNFINCEASENTVGFDIGGTSDVVGDTTDDPSWTSGAPITEANRTNRSHLNNFTGCLSHDNSIGVRIINGDSNIFENSRSYENTNIGVWQNVNSYNNKFGGECYGNGNFGVRNTDRSHVFDATNTWWGDITGPSGAGSGSGEKISTYVTFEPWLRSGTEPDLIYPSTRAWIWEMLGYPLMRVELTESHVTHAIEMAIDKWMYYQTPEPNWAYIDVAEGTNEFSLADLKDKNGNAVSIIENQIIEVCYQPYADIYAQLTGSESSFFLTYYMQYSGGTFLSDFYVAMGYKDVFEQTLGIFPTWEFISSLDNQNNVIDSVRLYPIPSQGLKVGVKYSRALTEAEVDNEKWIRMYALTYAKEQLGRIRSKFASLPSPTGETSLDGAALIAEAQQEREWLLNDAINRSEPLSFSIG